MNPVKRWWWRRRLRTAAKWHAAGRMADVGYAAFAIRVIMRLDGRELAVGDHLGDVAFQGAARKVLKEVGPQTGGGGANLAARYGPYLIAPMLALKGGIEWTATNEGDYRQVLNGIALPVRFEQWFAAKRAQYPALTSAFLWIAAWLVTTVVAFFLGRLTH